MPIPTLFEKQPDLKTRAALFRLQAPQLTAPEAMRIANREGIDAENARAAADRNQAANFRAANPGGIDVLGYSGSMYRGGVTPITLGPGANEAGADAFLRSRFGPPPNERGQVDIATANTFRSVNTGQGPVPAAMMVPARPSPDLVVPSAMRETPSYLRGTALDPAEADIRRQMDQTRLEGGRLSNESVRREFQVQDDERAALAAATSPSVAAAEGIRAGGMMPGRSATQDEDPGLKYFRAGGRNPAVASSLQRQPRTAAPGSNGVVSEDLPGVGTIVRDRLTGEPLDGGKIIKESEKKNDVKALTATEVQQIQSLQQAARDLTTLEGAFKEIGDKDWGGPVAGRIRPIITAGTDVNTSRIRNLVTAATPNLARGVFREVGVLTDEDVKRYQKLLPDVTDTAAQRAAKLSDLRKRHGETLTEVLDTLRAAGRDVSGLREKIAGDAAKKETAGADTFKDTDGSEYKVLTIRGTKGVVKGDGKFYPIVK